MKITNVVFDFNVGGIQKLLLEYLRHFKDSNDIDYKVVVLASNRHSDYDIICEQENLKIHYLNCEFSKNKHYYIRKFLKWYRFNFRLLKYLKKEKPDIVHSHNTRMLTLIETCIKKTINKYKWFHTLHSDPYAVHEIHIPVANRVFNMYKVRAICLNETQFLKAKERYGLQKCLYLYNCFDQQKLKQNIIPEDEFKKQLGINPTDYVVGAVGRLDPVKNYPFMLDVFNQVYVENPHSALVICGYGSEDDYKQLKEKARNYGFENKLFLLGNRNDVQNIYNILDVFIQTSLTEASSFTVLEAQSFGVKCVVSTAISKESVCFDNMVIRLPLEEPLSSWGKEVLNPNRFEHHHSTLNEYSIDNISKKMIKLYLEV